MSKNTEKNTMVIINLDRPRFLRFGHKALKQKKKKKKKKEKRKKKENRRKRKQKRR